MKASDTVRTDTNVGVVELLNERAYTFDSADNARKYHFARNFAEGSRPYSVHGIVLDGEPLAVFGAGGGPSGVHECSLAYVSNSLYLAVGDSVVCVELKPFLFKWVLKTDEATCFGVHFEERRAALISHGELEIARFSADGNILWRASGADIFTGAFSLKLEFIEAADWNGRVYRFKYRDGSDYERPGQAGHTDP
jgi:hypothetical protein